MNIINAIIQVLTFINYYPTHPILSFKMVTYMCIDMFQEIKIKQLKAI